MTFRIKDIKSKNKYRFAVLKRGKHESLLAQQKDLAEDEEVWSIVSSTKNWYDCVLTPDLDFNMKNLTILEPNTVIEITT